MLKMGSDHPFIRIEFQNLIFDFIAQQFREIYMSECHSSTNGGVACQNKSRLMTAQKKNPHAAFIKPVSADSSG